MNLIIRSGKFQTWVSIPAAGDGDLRMRENVSWPLLFFKILENADGLTRKIRLKEEGGDDRRIREKDEGTVGGTPEQYPWPFRNM